MKKLTKFSVMILFFFVFLFEIPSVVDSASGDIYWISPIGTVNWQECESVVSLSDEDCCSLATANDNAFAGDVINLREGTYNTQIDPANSGTSSSNRIIYQAYNDESVIITNTGTYSNGIILNGNDYIKIDGVTITDVNGKWANIRNGAHYNEIVNCTFYDSGEHVSGASFRLWGQCQGGSPYNCSSTHNWIHNNTFYRNGWVEDGTCDDKGGLVSIGSSGETSDYSSNNLFENNILYHGGHHCLEVNAPLNVIRNNYMHNEGWMDCSQCDGKPALCGNRCAGSSASVGHRNLWEGNTFAFGGIPSDNQMGEGMVVATSNNIIRYNRMYNNSGAGMNSYNKQVYSPADNNHIYSNTMYHNGYNDNPGPIPTAGINIVRSYNNSIKNNILYDNKDGAFHYRGGDPTASPDLQKVIENNWDDADGDPLFVDPEISDPFDESKPNLRLQPESEAIDGGTWLTTITSPSGSGNEFTVEDADYFMDGWEIIEGDAIQLEGFTKRVRITEIDYDTEEITINETITWGQGQGVSLAYEGSAPDIGAYEFPLDCPDSDIDGYLDKDCGGTDCDDTDPLVNPSAEEICDDEIDNDCDGYSDLDDPDCQDCDPEERQSCDTGLLGVCAGGTITCDSDGFWGICEQDIFASYEICDDEIDNDCDGLIDFKDEEDCFLPECPDEDQDGYLDILCGGHDCDDRDEYIFPDAEEICGDEIDNDCDTYIDDLDAECNNEQEDVDSNETGTEISGAKIITGGCGMIEKKNREGMFSLVLFLIVACFIFVRRKE